MLRPKFRPGVVPLLRCWPRLAAWAGCCAVLAALCGFLFRPHLTRAASFSYDFSMAYYAMTAYWIASVQAGEWPQWVPYQFHGYPFHMNPQSTAFYPPFWALVVARQAYTLYVANVLQVLHILFGGLGLLVLARRLFGSLPVALCGAVSFILFGGIYTNAQHPDYIRGFVWLPWVFAAALLTGPARQPDWQHWSWRHWPWHTRLTPANLLLPGALLCFVTSAYPGLLVAGLACLALFVAVQSWPSRATWRTAAAEVLALGLLTVWGLLLAAVFLVPGLVLSGQLVRSRSASTMEHLGYTAADLLNLLFPTPAVHTGDHSMYGQQLPLVLLPFALYAGRQGLRRLLPFLVPAGFALLMSLQAARPAAGLLMECVPPLGLSRFTAADYRFFYCFALLLTALQGLANALRASGSAAVPVRYCGGLLLLVWLGVSVLRAPVPAYGVPFLLDQLAAALLGAAVLAFCWRPLAQRGWLGAVPLILAAAVVAVMLPVITSVRDHWQSADVEQYVYDSRGLPLIANGQLQVVSLFHRFDRSRPARQTAPSLVRLSWRGYVDGTYMTGDINPRAATVAHQRAESEPALAAFLRRPSELLTLPCAAAPDNCRGPADRLPLAGLATTGRTVLYLRNEVVHEVTATAPALVIENELYAPGWHAWCERHGEQLAVRPVNGSLRAWVVPAGGHRVHLRYATPALWPALALSALALAAWLLLLAAVYRGRPRWAAC